MRDNSIQVSEYHALGLNVIPVHREDKVVALRTFAWWQYDQQEAGDLRRVIYSPESDVAVLGGVPSGNAFYVDCETPECFDEFSRATSAHAGPHAAVASRRGGHLWLRAPFPVAPHTYGDFEIRGQGDYVLAPPSRHPSGVEYEFTSDIRNIPVVTSLPYVTLEPKFVPRVSRFAHDLFRGREVREYESRSHRDQAFILSLVRSGFDQTNTGKFLSIVEFDSKYKGLLRENERSAQQYLEFSFKRALALPETEAFTETRSIVARWEQWAIAEKWTGRTGAVDRAVFFAHLYCANSAGSLVYNASVRQMAELAQTSPITISRANRRLADLGMIQLHKKNFGFDAFAYALHSDAPQPSPAKLVHAGDSGTYLFMSRCTTLAGDPFQAVWEHQGFGKTAQLLWECLATEQPSYRIICETSGRSLRTVERLMPKLIKYGLAVETPTGYKQAGRINWQEMAQRLGVESRQALRMTQHQQQRESYRKRFTKEGG